METFTAKYEDLATMFRATVVTRGTRPFLGTKRHGRWEWTTYAEFEVLVLRARSILGELGVAKGDRVAIISNNRLEWAVCAYATWSLGAVYVAMYETQLDKDWRFILNDCTAKLCFAATTAIFEKVSAMKGGLPNLAHVLSFDPNAKGDVSFADRMRRATSGGEAAVAPVGTDEAVFVYTSGTTGNPKGVRLSHANLTANICCTEHLVELFEDDRGLCILPWAHAAGLAELNTIVLHGISTGICEGVDKIAEGLAEIRPTWLVAVPRIWHKFHDAVQKNVATKPKLIQRIYKRAMRAGTLARKKHYLTVRDRLAIALAERLIYPKIRERLGGRVTRTMCGAAALSIDVAHFIENLGISVYEVYGLTETSPIATAMRPGDNRLGSVGRAVPGVTLELDRGVAGGDDENGEIIVYGHGVMLGYYRLPEETAQSIGNDGGLRTGDLGRIDKEGFLYITGRVKEVYKLENGKFVAPVPIEEKICMSPYVAQAMVHGLNKPHNVALLVVDVAAITPWCEKHGVPARSVDEMLAHPRVRALIKEEIASNMTGFKNYERVIDFALVAEEFATANDMLTPTLKLKRRNVLTKYGAKLEALYS